ncbi:non-ribosomal peptide synthetase/MFS transporter [Pseudonocardia sp. DLS-67]
MTIRIARNPAVPPGDGPGRARPGLVDEIVARAAERPSAQALVDGDRVLTYGELVAAAQGVAELLVAAGVGSGEPVGTPAVREADNIVAMLGVLLAGAAFVPLDPADPPQRLAEMVHDVGAGLCVADPDRYPQFASAGLTCLSARAGENPTPRPAAEPDPAARTGEATVPGDGLPAYVIHTSGTTGRAKGVAVPLRALEHFSRVSVAHFEMTPDDRALQFFSLAFDASIEDVFPPLLAGATIVLRDDEMVLSIDRFVERCAQLSITVLMLPTAFWHEMVDAMERDGLPLPPTVRLVTIGGEQVRSERVQKWRRLPMRPDVRLVNEYGPTETTVTATTDELAGPGAEPDAEEPTIGRPLPGVVARVVDEAGNDVPAGEPGELLLGGPTVAIGYLGQPERTAERFGTDAEGRRFYRTGDRVRLRSDGRLAFFGRMDRQLKVQGHRIERAGVEQVLLGHPLVDDAVVDLDPVGGLLVGYLVLDAGAAGRDDEVLADVRRHAGRRLPAYSVPHHLRRVAVLPRTDRDKVDVAALHRAFAPAVEPVGGAGTGTERDVRAIVGEVLGAEPDLDSPLLDLGAHSLAMVQIATRLARRFGVRPAVGELHGAVTVRGVAALVAGREAPEPQAAPARAASRMTGFQRDTWLADQLHPGTALHTIGVRYRLVGVTDPAAVQAALDAVVRRHDALRARFHQDGDEPVMDLGAEARPVPIAVHRADGADVDGLRRDRGRTVLDPAAGDLLAATLILGNGEAELIVAVHHLVFDGWSAAVLADELAVALAGGEPVPAGSFAEHLTRTSPDSSGYWVERLAGLDTEVWIPTDRPRPAVRSFRGDRVEAPIGGGRFRRISELAEQAGTSTATVFLAGLQALVARLTGRSDITVLSPVAHRTELDSERAIGAYLTVVPLRTEVAAGADFREILARAHGTVLGALDHDDPPLADLPAALGIPARSGRSPFGQVSLMVHTTPSAVARCGDAAVEFVGSTHPGRTKLDLTFSIDFPAGEPVLYLEYATELYDRATACGLVEQLLALLDEVTADPARPVVEPRGTAEGAERDRILHDWGATDPAEPSAEAPHRLFERHAAETPDAPALTFRGETVSYGELNRRANRLAHHLRERGVGPEVRVAICLDRGPDVFVAMWAVLKSGGAYVPLDPDYPAERLRFMLEDSAPAILLTRRARAETMVVPAGVEIVALDRDRERIADLPDTDPAPVTRSCDAAYLIYTSGSSGRPKGVTVEHGHLAHATAMWQQAYRLRAEWTYQQAASFSFDMFVGETLRAHCTGGRLVIVPRETLLDPAALYDLMRTERVACTELVPTVLRRLLAHAGTRPERLDLVELLIGGGEKWDVQDFRRARQAVGPRGRVVNAYGVTEVTVDNVYFDGDVDGLPDDAPLPIGRPFPGNRVYVLDERRSPVPAGVVGELYLGGDGVARGYHERPELDAERFVPDPFSPVPGARMYRTGDGARWRRDGVVEYLGRLDQQVKINGYRVELGEVEAVLATLPGIEAAAAAVHRGPGGHAYLVGYVVGGADAPPAEPSLRERMSTLVPVHLVPSRIVAVPALPQTPNGKIDRAALPEPAPQPLADREPTPREAEVADVWRAVLRLGDDAAVGVDDNFFELGGDSFSALRIVRRLDPPPPLLTLYQNPTVAAVAAWMDGPAGGGAGPDRLLHRLTRGEADPGAGGVTVVAVPYSGGSAVSYQPLADALPDGWALYAAELPGHEWARPDDPLLGVDETAARIADEVRALRGPVLLYGHCLGVAITVDVARRLERDGVEPAGVALGAAFPTARLPGRLFDLFYRLVPQDRLVSDRAYLAYLRGRGGFTDVGGPEQQAFVLRNVRHDAQGAEEYFTALFRRAGRTRLRAPVLSLVGGRDRVTEMYEERHREWEPLAESVDLAVIPRAGHFFVRTHAAQLAQALRAHASPPLTSAGPGPDEPAPAGREPRGGPDPGLRRFAAVAGGQLVSMLGSAITALVLSIWVFRETGSITQFAVVSALGMLPGIVASPFAGAAADRWDRRKLMLASDVGAAAAMAIVGALALGGGLRLWHVYLAVTAASLATAFQRPAYLAAVAQLVPKRYLGRTNGISQLGAGMGVVFAPMLGVPLMHVIGVGGVIAVDIGSYLVAIATVLAVRFPDRLFRRREEPFTSEIAGGWRYVARRPPLLASLRYFIVDNVFYLLGFAVIMPLLLSEQSPVALSAALTAGGLGAVSAALVMGLSGGTPRRADGMLLFMGVCSVGMVGVGVSTSPVLIVCGMFLMAFGESMATAHWMTLLQVKVGFELQGRVLSFFLTVMLLTEPLGYLVVGPFADAVVRPLLEPGTPLAHLFGPLLGTGATRGLALLLVLSGVLQFAWAVRGWFLRPVRRIEDLLPDAIPPDELGDREDLQRLADSSLPSRS